MVDNELSKAQSNSMTISVVVPVYNGETSLVELVDRMETVLSPLARNYEVILVNDGSKDNSWHQISCLVESKKFVRGINLMHNYGQHNALIAGIQSCYYDIIVTSDDDLQHPPEEIPKLLAKLRDGYDVVYGRPMKRHHSLWRNISSKVLKAVLRLVLGAEMGGHSSAFRVFRANLRRGFANFKDAQLSIDVLLSWSAARVTHVIVEHSERRSGKSGYTLKKLMSLAFNMLTGYSTIPLRIASGLGLLTSIYGLMVFLYVIIQRLIQTNYVPGFTFLAAEVALFAGLQLFSIGVIGEYVARLHFRTMGKPPYVIREEIGCNKSRNT